MPWALGKSTASLTLLVQLAKGMCSGSAAHGDYMFGWEGDSLQRAMDNGCSENRNCPAAGLTVAQPNVYNNCRVPQAAPEQVDGCKHSHFLSEDDRTDCVCRASCAARRRITDAVDLLDLARRR